MAYEPAGFDMNEAERKNLYWMVWKLLAKYSSTLVSEDKQALMDIVQAYYRDEKYDPLVVTHVRRMFDMLKPSYI